MNIEIGNVDQQLMHWLTPEGVVKWWHRPHPALAGLTPMEAWDRGMKRAVYETAVAGRSMGGT